MSGSISLLFAAAWLVAPPTDTLTLDPTATTAVGDLFSGVEAELLGAVRGGDAEQATVEARASADQTEGFKHDLRAFLTRARTLGTIERVALNSFEVQTTLWFGLVPVKEVSIWLYRASGGLRILRMTTSNPAREVFDGVREGPWTTDAGLGFRALAAAIVDSGAERQCHQLPILGRADYGDRWPKDAARAEKTQQNLDRFRTQAQATCAVLEQLPFHRVSVALGEVGGVVHGARGTAYPFQVDLQTQADGRVALRNLRVPMGGAP